MLDRLIGLETEYAIRFSSQHGLPRPPHEVIFRAVKDAVAQRVQTQPGERQLLAEQIFLENGGALAYEAPVFAPHDGLVEGATPECRSPSELLLYQRTQDALLKEVLPDAETNLAIDGHPCTLGLLKNCRDAEGHIYGAQENYEVDAASGWRLWLYRLFLGLMMPILLMSSLAVWLLVASGIALVLTQLILMGIGALFSKAVRRQWALLLDEDADITETPALRWIGGFRWLELGAWTPSIVAFGAIHRAFAFRRIRRGMLAFLIARPALTGAGTLHPDGRFGLSEKGPAINVLTRWTPASRERAIFDVGNLMKHLPSLSRFRPQQLGQLFARRQRMQLGLSDSNLAQVAEYLKIGCTSLVLDAVEAGLLNDAPRPKQPLRALQRLIEDPSLTTEIEMRNGPPMTALDILRFYLERVTAMVDLSETPALEAQQIIKLWRSALEQLEQNPAGLVGRLDWVTKRYLIETAGANQPYATQKTIDLRYHELPDGYYCRMEADGLTETLVDADELEAARYQPPGTTPARIRGRWIKDLAGSSAQVRVSWNSIRVGGTFRGQVIRLDDYRDSR